MDKQHPGLTAPPTPLRSHLPRTRPHAARHTAPSPNCNNQHTSFTRVNPLLCAIILTIFPLKRFNLKLELPPHHPASSDASIVIFLRCDMARFVICLFPYVFNFSLSAPHHQAHRKNVPPSPQCKIVPTCSDPRGVAFICVRCGGSMGEFERTLGLQLIGPIGRGAGVW